MAEAPRLPKSVSVTDLAARRGLEKKPVQPQGTRPVSHEELRARLAHDVVNNSGVPVDNSHQLQEERESSMELPVLEILHYDRNPRKSQNDNYDDIKESIRATKRLTSPLVVTRRPGQKQFMVAMGGNTRLTILQELFNETGDPAFQRAVVTYVPWKSETETLAAHMRENELRGAMCFWDKAKAYAEIKALLEEEIGSKLSGRGFEQALRERGLPVGKSAISYFNFAVGQLEKLGEACQSLTMPKVNELQPAFNAHEKLFKHFVQEAAWVEVRDQVLKSTEQSWLATRELDPTRLVDQMDQAVALRLEEAVEFVKTVRDLCQQNDDVAGMVAQARLLMKPAIASPSPVSAPSSTPAPGHSQSTTDDANHPNELRNAGREAGLARNRTPKSENELIAIVQEIATRFARQSQVADCLRLSESWPSGFYVEVPENDEPIDLVEDGLDRYHGWWMLAMLSEQLDGAWSHLMPLDSTWRQAQRREKGRDEFALQHYMDTILGMPIDPLTLGKRLSSNHDSIALWIDLVGRLRELRVVAPGRFDEEGGAS